MIQVETDNKFVPIAILMDELRNDDIQTRINSIEKLTTVALVLGAERTRLELIPFLTETVNDDDEVLVALAEQLKRFPELVGGSEFVFCLLGPLEALAGVEETLVRERAVETLRHLVPFHSESDLEYHFVPMLKRLSSCEWFTGRSSACGLYSSIFARLSAGVQSELVQWYRQLCLDDTPMVRRAAAEHLGDLVRVMTADDEVNHGQSLIRSIMVPLLSVVAQDDQDSVRLWAVECSARFAEALSNEDDLGLVEIQIVPIVQRASVDKSWRVRSKLAETIVQLQTSFGPRLTVDHLVPIYEKLLSDSEPEVKTNAVEKMADFCRSLCPKINDDDDQEDQRRMREEMIMCHILPSLQVLFSGPPNASGPSSSLSTNETSTVFPSSVGGAGDGVQLKTCLARQAMGMVTLLSAQNVIKHLVPLFLAQLDDANAEVRSNVIETLGNSGEINQILVGDDRFVPALVRLGEDKKWRVRLAVVELVPRLALFPPTAKADPNLTDRIVALCSTRLSDDVFTVREAAVSSLRALIAKFGLLWASHALLPQIRQLAVDTNYLHRMICLLFVEKVAEVCDASDIAQVDFMDLLVKLSHDKVPNVRFKTAQVLAQLGPKIDRETISTVLTRLKNDSDTDVAHFAYQAVRQLNL